MLDRSDAGFIVRLRSNGPRAWMVVLNLVMFHVLLFL
ncbi:hypothetical protein LINGRAHAP2_LOCUS37023 [Linum grandiflorum]